VGLGLHVFAVAPDRTEMAALRLVSLGRVRSFSWMTGKRAWTNSVLEHDSFEKYENKFMKPLAACALLG